MITKQSQIEANTHYFLPDNGIMVVRRQEQEIVRLAIIFHDTYKVCREFYLQKENDSIWQCTVYKHPVTEQKHTLFASEAIELANLIVKTMELSPEILFNHHGDLPAFYRFTKFHEYMFNADCKDVNYMKFLNEN